MTDTIEQTTPETEIQEQSVADPEGTNEATTEAPAEKPKREKKVVEPHACACQAFEVGEEVETETGLDRTVFTTECAQETQRVFAQGHDARLVSFLVQAQMDGYTIWRSVGGQSQTFPGATEAAASISEALGEKARKAVDNAQGRENAKAQRKAERDEARAKKAQEKAEAKAKREQEKANKPTPEKELAEAAGVVPPREVPVNVVSGSVENDGTDGSDAAGPTELAEGEKVVTIKVGRNEIQATLSANGQVVSWRNSAGEYKERSVETVRIIEA